MEGHRICLGPSIGPVLLSYILSVNYTNVGAAISRGDINSYGHMVSMIKEPFLSRALCSPTPIFRERLLVSVGFIVRSKAYAISPPPGVFVGDPWALVETTESSLRCTLSLLPPVSLQEALIPTIVG